MKGLKNKDCGFAICNNKGFHIKLSNGWTVSVQFGFDNYCEHYPKALQVPLKDRGKKPMISSNAEVYSRNRDHSKCYPKEPLGWQTPDEVLKFINKVAKRRDVQKKRQR